MWVQGHNGEEGSEAADRKAKMEVEMGWRMNKPDIARHWKASRADVGG